jgi:hypothetical protein
MGRNTLPEEGNVSMTKSKDWAKGVNNTVVDDDYIDLIDTASSTTSIGIIK